jgi:hypothetical protein
MSTFLPLYITAQPFGPGSRGGPGRGARPLQGGCRPSPWRRQGQSSERAAPEPCGAIVLAHLREPDGCRLLRNAPTARWPASPAHHCNSLRSQHRRVSLEEWCTVNHLAQLIVECQLQLSVQAASDPQAGVKVGFFSFGVPDQRLQPGCCHRAEPCPSPHHPNGPSTRPDRPSPQGGQHTQ